MLKLILVFTILTILWSDVQPCGYDKCNLGKPDMLNIHFLPHSHSDVGWDKTVDEYFYGAKNYIQDVGMQYNLDAIMQALYFNKERRFTWIEIAYFWRWWEEKDEFMKNIVRQLISEGRLMFGNNAWGMNDEGSPYYQEIIDQHTLGQEFLSKEFGECGRPRTAWQIDTFGHSREMANMMALMGHDSFYFGRLDYQDREARISNKSMQMVWITNTGTDHTNGTMIFANAMYNLYIPPDGFNFEWDVPIMDDPRLFGNNVEERIQLFVREVREWSKAYPTNHLLLPMGSDFTYERTNRWFINMDKLIHHINSRSDEFKINIIYSTAPCYTYAVQQTGYRFTTKLDDFFPYADTPHRFWTGTFTSRPNLKGYVRDSNALLQTCKQLASLSVKDADLKKRVDYLRHAMGIDTNHGQFGGTQQQLVAFDNALRLSNGSLECEKIINAAYRNIGQIQELYEEKIGEGNSFQLCTLLNISSCSTIDNVDGGGTFEVTFYNQLSRSVNHWARIPVVSDEIMVTHYDGTPVLAQVIPVSNRTKSIPERESRALFEIVHSVTVPPMGFQRILYTVQPLTPISNFLHKSYMKSSKIQSISNKRLRLEFHPLTGLLHRVIDLLSGKTITFSVDMRYYTSFVGECGPVDRTPSGRFIFRPNEEAPNSFPTPKISVVMGPIVQEVLMQFDIWATLVIRLYTNETEAMFEVEWTAGPIPMNGLQGKELVVYYSTNLNTSSGQFYTDSSGRQIMKRQINYRPTWKFENSEPVSGNYHPVTNMIFLQDDVTNDEFAVILDRSQAASSLHSGEIELMVHRRMGQDDCLGTNEALNETGADGNGLIARGKHWIVFGDRMSTNRLRRLKSQEMQMRPTISARIIEKSDSYFPPRFQSPSSYSALTFSLPYNVHLLTLEPFRDGKSLLLRLEHIFDWNENEQLSKPVSVEIGSLFQGKKLVEMEEYSLSGALPLTNMTRLQWNTQGNVKMNHLNLHSTGLRTRDFSVTLQPMDIKTFRIVLEDTSNDE